MPSAIIRIHSSQFPAAVRCDLLQSLRARQVNHKFHYDSIKQTHKWLALHSAYSPSRQDLDCVATYERAFEAAAKRISTERVHLTGLGCGGGQKDTRLLNLLKAAGKQVFYTPSDVSAAMVLIARETALASVSARDCFPIVCDLASAEDLPEIFEEPAAADAGRLFTFFGMIPNFEPGIILPRLSALVRRGDRLLFSANLAPGSDYEKGMQKVLPQYDNALTRDWLLTFLLDLGVERSDGQMRFDIESDEAGLGLRRVTASFHFTTSRVIEIETERFEFRSGDSIRLFFSYRYQPDRLGKILGSHGLDVMDQWITESREEGIFLISRR